MSDQTRSRTATRTFVWYTTLFFVFILVAAYGLLMSRGGVGDGTFEQIVLVESPRQATRLWYTYGKLEEEGLRLADQNADPRLIESSREAKVIGPSRFSITVWHSERYRAFWVTRRSYQKHFTICVESAEGSPTCQVIEIPDGYGKEPLVLRLP